MHEELECLAEKVSKGSSRCCLDTCCVVKAGEQISLGADCSFGSTPQGPVRSFLTHTLHTALETVHEGEIRVTDKHWDLLTSLLNVDH
jgi:hypothetical protein